MKLAEYIKRSLQRIRSGAEIFLAPNQDGKQGSNYQIALKTAKDIGTDMEVVPVDTFDEAIDFLKNLEPKK